jgi:hypothetical protein
VSNSKGPDRNGTNLAELWNALLEVLAFHQPGRTMALEEEAANLLRALS